MSERNEASSGPLRRATLKDVAERAGVSMSTTSRAITGDGYAAASVRERVMAAAAELGYVPHAMARSLRTKDSHTVGVVISDLRNPFYADLAAGAAEAARRAGLTVLLVDSQGSAQAELEAARAFVAARVSGVVLTPLSAEVTAYLMQQQVAVVETDRQFWPGECDGVVIDNGGAARRMTDHLIALGHRRIALVIDETTWTTGEARFGGYRASLRDAGIDFDPKLVVTAGWSADEARTAAVDLLAQRQRPTAVFAANNLLAEGVWRAVADLRLRVPLDVSIVAFDESQWMTMVDPGVTAVAQDAVGLGCAAVELLLARRRGESGPATTTVLNAEIHPRGSMGPPGQA